ALEPLEGALGERPLVLEEQAEAERRLTGELGPPRDAPDPLPGGDAVLDLPEHRVQPVAGRTQRGHREVLRVRNRTDVAAQCLGALAHDVGEFLPLGQRQIEGVQVALGASADLGELGELPVHPAQQCLLGLAPLPTALRRSTALRRRPAPTAAGPVPATRTSSWSRSTTSRYRSESSAAVTRSPARCSSKSNSVRRRCRVRAVTTS